MLGTPLTDQAKSRPGISVLIRTYNSDRTLGEVLKRLPTQKNDELIIVDSGSTDTTISLAQSYRAQIARFDRPFNYSGSLNLGFEKAKNDWVLVISSHAIPQSPDLLEHVRNFARIASTDFVVGYGTCHLVTAAASSRDERLAEASESEPEILLASEITGNGLAVYRKSAWLQHKFDENTVTAEDLEWFIWAQSKGYTGARIYGANAIYRNQGSLAHMFRKGWNEVKQARILLPRQSDTIHDSVYGWILGNLRFLKLTVTRQLPLGSMLRQQSHLLGAFLARLLIR